MHTAHCHVIPLTTVCDILNEDFSGSSTENWTSVIKKYKYWSPYDKHCHEVVIIGTFFVAQLPLTCFCFVSLHVPEWYGNSPVGILLTFWRFTDRIIIIIIIIRPKLGNRKKCMGMGIKKPTGHLYYWPHPITLNHRSAGIRDMWYWLSLRIWSIQLQCGRNRTFPLVTENLCVPSAIMSLLCSTSKITSLTVTRHTDVPVMLCSKLLCHSSICQSNLQDNHNNTGDVDHVLFLSSYI